LYSSDIGVRNWPTAERGPKLSIAIAQPQQMTTAGVRQDMGRAVEEMVVIEQFQQLAGRGRTLPPRRLS
jgi:hypothetical protein